MERPSRRTLMLTGAAGTGVLATGAGVATILTADTMYFHAARRRLARTLRRHHDAETAGAMLRAFDTQHTLTPRDDTVGWGRMRFHAEVARIAEALYRTYLGQHYERELAVDKVHWVMWDALLSSPSRIVETLLQEGDDPFDRFSRMHHLVWRAVYPRTGFDWRWDATTEGFRLQTTRCYYADVFARRGIPELTRVFCDMDLREAELLPSQVAVERFDVMASGTDGRCDLLYHSRRAA